MTAYEGHPRPQLTRPGWVSLDGQWRFAHDDADQGVRNRWIDRPEMFDRVITVPYPPESPASGIGDRDPHPVLWYRRTFTVDAGDHDHRWLLHFGAVDYLADVWVNGHHVARHEGGHTPFSADLTGALAARDEQVVVVRAEDRPEDLTQPRGKQYWGAGSEVIWYHRTSGIWQTVWLEPVPADRIEEIRWAADLDRERLTVTVRTNRPMPGRVTVAVRLTLRDDVLADDVVSLTGTETTREIGLRLGVPSMLRSRRWLWSPEYPNLLDAEVRLIHDEETVDRVGSYIGLRSVRVTDGRLVLNGRPYYMRLVLSQGYWPQTQLAPPDDAALRAEVEHIKALGFNGVRMHQKVEDPRFLYWCDRLGLLVWSEMPSAYTFSDRAIERFTREWLDVVRRDYSHPCIILWLPFNESWGVPALASSPAQQAYVRGIYHLTHALDGTRPVVGNDGWENVANDIYGVHDYTLDGTDIEERYGTLDAVERTIREVQPKYHSLSVKGTIRGDEPVVLTEFGGISFSRTPAPGVLFAYGTVRDETEFVQRYGDLLGAVLRCRGLAGFCYTQLCDTEQEANGLLYADRTPKVDPAAIREITQGTSAATPGDAMTANILASARQAAADLRPKVGDVPD
jgi:beta-galactosidase/beta-glucuronidase